MVDFNSPTYPYERVLTGLNKYKGMEEIPYKLLIYLLDLPDQNGYYPVDDNSRPRVRLAKYLWYDGANPLQNPLPSADQKRSLLFDPDNPVLDTDEQKAKHPKGYRLVWQKLVGQSQVEAETEIKCYFARVISNSDYVDSIGIRFEISVNVNHETNLKTNAYERSVNIEQCIREALNGVNITGIGVVKFSRMDHIDNGSGYLYDYGTNVGRYLHCSIDWAESDQPGITIY